MKNREKKTSHMSIHNLRNYELKLIFLSTTNSFHQIISKKAKTKILFLLKNTKNNNIISVISI